MKHSIIYKNKDRYASFPLLKQLDDRILIGFFTAPVPDHMGIFWWNVWESFDDGETWQDCGAHDYDEWLLPTSSPRELSDRLFCRFGPSNMITGSPGFMITDKEITKSKHLFQRWISNVKASDIHRIYKIPGVDIIATFPRFFREDNLILIPAYAILSEYDDISRCLIWRSEDGGKSFNLWNMFPDGVDGNEMAFIEVGINGIPSFLTGGQSAILAHIRSDNHPYLMESWSFDKGLTWTYPTLVFISKEKFIDNVIGGPPHLLRLKDGRILCSYGYRFGKMGIRAIISEDEGETWSRPIVLRDDAGYASSLHKKKWLWKKLRFSRSDPAMDCGYPVSIQLEDKSILTVYYLTTSDKITHIASTKWEV